MDALRIVLIVLLLILVYYIIRYILIEPHTLQGIQNGTSGSIISASSLASNGSNVPSSNFAYAIWFYVNDWNYRYGEPKVIFGRMGAKSTGGADGSIDGISGLDPCPAVVLGAVENNIAVSLGCYPGIDQEPTTPGGTTVVHTASISNIPIQKWVHLLISVYGRTMDLYIDGKLVRTSLLPGVACINVASNIYVTPSGGFNGWTSKLQYYPDSINPQEAWNIYKRGYSSWISIFNTYQIQFSLIENGTTQSSLTV